MTFFQPIFDTKTIPYCGASAIAILTGVPLSRIEHMIRRCRGAGWKRKPIKGTYSHEVQKVLKRLGCKTEEIKNFEGTISKFADDVRYAGAYLVSVAEHFMVTCAGIVADNSSPAGVPAEEYGRGARRVQRAWKVIAPALPKFTIDDALMTSKPAKPKRDIKATRAAKVAADIKRWERKEKLAKTKLKKLRVKQRYYEKQNATGYDQ